MTKEIKTIALVTGASDGIGKEIARQLAGKGIHVLLGSRSLEKGQGVVEELSKDGLKVELVQLDTSDEASVSAAAELVEKQYGRLDILINNAGVALDRTPISQLKQEDLEFTFQTNVFGTFRVTRLFLPLVKASEHGRIVNVSSGLASLLNMTDETSPYYQIALPSYAASKAALNVLTVHFSRELKGTKAKINAVCPGLTATRYVEVPGAQPVEAGAVTPIRYALLDDDGPTGGFFDVNGVHNW